MNRVYSLETYKMNNQSAILIFGVFDGMHIGHQKLIEKAIDIKKNLGGEIVVCTFSSNIGKICDDKTERMIDTLDERLDLLEKIGVDTTIVCEFTEEFKNTSAQSFIEQIKKYVNPKNIIAGFDYRFGKGAEGDSELLKKEFKNVDIIDAVNINCDKVSSSLLKQLIQTADFESFKKLSRRTFCLCGTVIKGRQDGRKYNYPTANIEIPCGKIVPKQGVYAVKVEINGAFYNGVANLGVSPTFFDDCAKLEVHILDFDQDIYGEKLKVLFYQFIRENVKFDSIEELYKQVDKDIEKTKDIFEIYA